jgi:hypothetical protein
MSQPFATKGDILALLIGGAWLSRYLVPSPWTEVLTSVVFLALAGLAWSTLQQSRRAGVLQLRSRSTRQASPKLFYSGLVVCAFLVVFSLAAAIFFLANAASR